MGDMKTNARLIRAGVHAIVAVSSGHAEEKQAEFSAGTLPEKEPSVVSRPFTAKDVVLP